MQDAKTKNSRHRGRIEKSCLDFRAQGLKANAMSLERSLKQQTNVLWELEMGAQRLKSGGVRFRVWSPRAKQLSVRVAGARRQLIPMRRVDGDVFEVVIPDLQAGADYTYVIDGDSSRPDPVSRWQPAGVHGPSRVLEPQAYAWADADWRGLPLQKFLIYELHVGTFTPEGTFSAIIQRLPYLKQLGITAIELMPVAEFPGGRNWGYDGVHLYAPQSTYGGPHELKRLVDACHQAGLAVVLDVVYNHLGPEGNYLADYANYFSSTYQTPWGEAINFDGPESDGVRRFFIDNALYWLTEYHVDALRLDAIHRIHDSSPRHILAEIADEFAQQAARLNRAAWLIAESDLNDVRVISPQSECGYGFNAQWSDDFHHSLHALLTRTRRGYFADFGRLSDLRKAIASGFVNDGRKSSYRRKRHGTSSVNRPGEQFVVFIQNHDQIANSYWGQRLSALVSLEQQKLAALILLCAPNLPMLFMGEEYGETSPFYYFTSHTDALLIENVRRGRKREYAPYAQGREFADPQAPGTFERSKLNWQLLNQSPHAELLRLYRDLIALRQRTPSLANCDKERTQVEYDEERQCMSISRGDVSASEALVLCNLSASEQSMTVKLAGDEWKLALWSSDALYGGEPQGVGPPPLIGAGQTIEPTVTLSRWSAAVYLRSD
jgi:maltooligosyltrehalose trehalohydrolase